MITPGTYTVKATAAQWSETKNKEEYLTVRFARVDAPEETILWMGFLGDKMDSGGKTQQQRTEDAMHAAGWKGDYLDLSTIGSCECEIVVQENEWQGKKTIQVRFVQPKGTAASFMPKKLDDAKARKFAERMAKRAKGVTEDDSGDVPF